MATVTKTGIKWVKVSKTDALGNNYDTSWRINNSFRLNYADRGSTQYNVNTVTEYSTYWLLGLNYVNVTSSLQGAKDYKVQATKKIATTSYTAGQSASLTNYTESLDTQGFFNATNGLYGQGNTINIPLIVTASFYCETTGTKSYPFIRLIITNEAGVSLGEPPVLEYVYTVGSVEPNLQVTLTGSFVPQYYNGVYYKIEVGNSASAADKINIGPGNTAFNLLITQSVAPASNTITILDPFITTPFEGTDCDVTYGLVDQVPYSQYKQDVDYSTGITVPTNQQLLTSGTATPAPVKDYYYSIARHTLPRYRGSRGQGYKYNIYTPQGTLLIDGQTLNYAGDISYGNDPLIDYQRSYAARFQYIAGFSPERFNTIFASVTDLVDENGTIFQPKLGSPTYYNLAGTFEQNDTAIITLLASQNASQFASLNGEFTVHKGGYRIEPIFYTSNGIEGNTTPYNTMSFNYYGTTYDTRLTSSTDFTFTNAKPEVVSGYEISSSATPIVSYSSVIWPGGAGQTRFNRNSGVYTFLPTDLINSTVQFELSTDIINYSTASSQQITIRLQEKTGSAYADKQTWSVTLGSQPDPGYRTDYYYEAPNQYQVKSNFFFPKPSASYRFTIEAPGVLPLDTVNTRQGAAYAYAAPTQIKLNQQIDAGNSDPTVGDGYFLTGSGRLDVLSASVVLSSKYNSIFKQVGITSSGYNPVTLPFTPKPGDEIRFNNLEAYTFMVYDVKDPKQEPDGRLKVFITPPLPISSSINTNVVLIRRYVQDANFILLNGGKPAGATPGGIIRPKYITDKLGQALEDSSIFTLQAGSSNPL